MGNAARTPGGGKLRRVLVGNHVGKFAPYITINVSEYLEERIWKKLTIENFGAQTVSNTYYNGYSNGRSSGKSSYNSNTGQLTWFTGTYKSGDYPSQIICDVYCWYVE